AGAWASVSAAAGASASWAMAAPANRAAVETAAISLRRMDCPSNCHFGSIRTVTRKPRFTTSRVNVELNQWEGGKARNNPIPFRHATVATLGKAPDESGHIAHAAGGRAAGAAAGAGTLLIWRLRRHSAAGLRRRESSQFRHRSIESLA